MRWSRWANARRRGLRKLELTLYIFIAKKGAITPAGEFTFARVLTRFCVRIKGGSLAVADWDACLAVYVQQPAGH